MMLLFTYLLLSNGSAFTHTLNAITSLLQRLPAVSGTADPQKKKGAPGLVWLGNSLAGSRLAGFRDSGPALRLSVQYQLPILGNQQAIDHALVANLNFLPSGKQAP
jgi:hypothetical protein